METAVSRLTVFFEGPFWVGVYEREASGRYEACKITFGAEPKDYEVYAFLLKYWNQLQFSPSMEAQRTASKPLNPKRLRRCIKRQLKDTGVGTKAQQALKLQQQQGKQKRKTNSREQRDAEKERRFTLHQAKRKEKHKGH